MVDVGEADPPVQAERPEWEIAQHQVLADLYRRRYGEFVSLAWAVVGRRPVAEDVVQDVFASVYRRPTPFADEERVDAYVARSIVNRARSIVRRDARVSLGVDDLDPELESSADRAAQVRQDQVAVQRALAQLPVRQRECAVCHFLFGLTHQETADVLGMRLGTVKTHVRRARSTLVRELGEPA